MKKKIARLPQTGKLSDSRRDREKTKSLARSHTRSVHSRPIKIARYESRQIIKHA
jgi:hypothetical protein